MSVENLKIYEEFRHVPEEAKKKIQGGRLNGKTDINPMWRIKKLTEMFGPVGKGWYAPITERWTESGANGEVTANIRINLFVKYDNDWSVPIEGVGGSMLIVKESAGLRTDDDAFKKAYTDAISVACKALGIGADVYWEKDPTKYTQNGEDGNGTDENVKPIKSSQKQPNKEPKIEDIKLFEKYGFLNLADEVAMYEKRLGNISWREWGDEIFNLIEDDLIKRKKKRDAEEQRKKGMQRIDDADIPFSMRD